MKIEKNGFYKPLPCTEDEWNAGTPDYRHSVVHKFKIDNRELIETGDDFYQYLGGKLIRTYCAYGCEDAQHWLVKAEHAEGTPFWHFDIKCDKCGKVDSFSVSDVDTGNVLRYIAATY